MHCSRRRLLRRGLEFHVCTINKSAHTKKSGNLFNDPRIIIIYLKDNFLLHLNFLLIAFVLFTVWLFVFFLNHWSTTSQYGLGDIHTDKHKTTPTRLSSKPNYRKVTWKDLNIKTIPIERMDCGTCWLGRYVIKSPLTKDQY